MTDNIKYVTAPSSEWRLPSEEAPPAGEMVQLLSIYGKATHGIWSNQGYWVAWAPFPKIPPHIKLRMLEQERLWGKK